jgi:hypothetical protein
LAASERISSAAVRSVLRIRGRAPSQKFAKDRRPHRRRGAEEQECGESGRDEREGARRSSFGFALASRDTRLGNRVALTDGRDLFRYREPPESSI